MRENRRPIVAFVILTTILITAHASFNEMDTQSKSSTKRPLLIAHRGASGYAPEHTLISYQFAIDQGADFVEQDLQITKDGALVCLHDPDLERTTNVKEVFPNRATERDALGTGTAKRGWYTVDFTLAEIKRLDAGSWFNRANPFAANPNFAEQRVPTMEEAIKLVGKRAGLYVELKHFPFYKSLGFDLAEKLGTVLKANGFDKPGQHERVLIQSFYKEGLLRMRELAPGYPRVQLLPMETHGREKDTAVITKALAEELATYANGAGPSKNLLKSAEDVAILHRAGLVIHPYTFRGTTTANARRPLDEIQSNGSTVRANIVEDIQRFIGYGIDGGFTDYPQLWKEAIESRTKSSK